MKGSKMKRELTDEERRLTETALAKGYAITTLKLAARNLRFEHFDELATAIDLLVVAVRRADDPRQITAGEKTSGVFE